MLKPQPQVLLVIAAFVSACLLPGVALADTRHVLLLYSYEREFAPHDAFARLFRPELGRLFPDPVDFVEVSLQTARGSQSAPDAETVDRLRAALAGRSFGLVVTIGGPAATFAQAFRSQLFPKTPLLMADVDRRFLQAGSLTDRDTAVAVEHDPTGMVEQILSLLPDTRTVIVVIGASQLEQFWLAEARREFRKFDGRLEFVWVNQWSYAEMLARVAALPQHSAILYGVLSLDGKGEPHVEAETLRDLHAVANAPVFGLHSTQLGRGIVGGPLISIEELADNAVKVAVRILAGEVPGNIKTPIQRPSDPAFDARELGRWNIREGRLPARSSVRFREPTAGQRYRPAFIAGAAVAGLPSLVFIGLAVYRGRRRRAAPAVSPGEERLRLLSTAEPVRIWAAGPDGRCSDIQRPPPGSDAPSIQILDDLGGGWISLVHPDDVERCLDRYHQAFIKREPFQMEYRVRNAQGKYRRVLDTGVPRFAGNVFAGYVGSTIEVEEFRAGDTMLSSLSRRLIQTHERERAAIARKLHEDVCQRMVGLTLRLHSVSGAAQDGGTKASVQDLCDQLSILVGDISAIPDPVYQKLDLLGLAAAVDGFCRDLAAQSHVHIEFRHHGIDGTLPDELAITAFRVIEEAVTNALRHSHASALEVSLRQDGDAAQIDVVDNGVGFDHDEATGTGLTAIRERLSLVGGNCAIESAPGLGTRIQARIPLQPASHTVGGVSG